jgi:hypothetical protein
MAARWVCPVDWTDHGLIVLTVVVLGYYSILIAVIITDDVVIYTDFCPFCGFLI